MSISVLLDVAIGIIFIYILMAVICSAIREGIEAWMKTRAVYLARGIRQLLADPEGKKGLADQFFKHPLIAGLCAGPYDPDTTTKRAASLWRFLPQRGHELPSYIPSKNFAVALMDLAVRGSDMTLNSGNSSQIISLASVRSNIARLDNERVQRALLTAIDTAQGDLDRAQKNLEAWFDSAMDRVSGWYKRSTQWIIFAIALFATVSLNVDTIRIVNHLYRDDVTRAELVKRAEKLQEKPLTREYKEAKAELENLKLPIGWDDGQTGRLDRPRKAAESYAIFLTLLGWLMTACAASLGAPFWFDVLNKVMVIRSTVKPNEKSPPEGSEDRQNSKAPVININTAETPKAGAGGAGPSTSAQTADENDVDATDTDLAQSEPVTDDQLPK